MNVAMFAEENICDILQDLLLAELLTNQKEWIIGYHEHDSLLENKIEQELSEEERKAAWEEYEQEKKGIRTAVQGRSFGFSFAILENHPVISEIGCKTRPSQSVQHCTLLIVVLYWFQVLASVHTCSSNTTTRLTCQVVRTRPPTWHSISQVVLLIWILPELYIKQ